MTEPFDGLEMETPLEDLAALRNLVELVDRPGGGDLRIVEVGSWVGRTALNFIQARTARDVRVYCIDHWQGTPNDPTSDLVRKHGVGVAYTTFLANCGQHLFRRIYPCVGYSEFWAERWPWQADLIFVDADHAYDALKRDLELWRRHVREGGILCGHDYGLNFEGVKRAVDELIPDRRLAGRCLWWTRVEHGPVRQTHNPQVAGLNPGIGTW